MTSPAPRHRAEVAEHYVLGAMMLDNDAIPEVTSIVNERDFYGRDERTVFAAIVMLWASGKPADVVAVVGETGPRLQEFVAELMGSVGTAANVKPHAEKVRDAADRRRLVREAAAIKKMAETDARETTAILGEAQTRIVRLSHRGADESDISDVVANTLRRAEAASLSDTGLVGVPTGFTALDSLTGGFCGGDLVVIAAETSVGKTAFMLNIIDNLIDMGGYKIDLYSLEMRAEQLMIRSLAWRTGIDMNFLRRGRLEPDKWAQVQEAAGAMAEKARESLRINDRAGVDPSYVRARSSQRRQSEGLHMICVDYLQKMSWNGKYESDVVKTSNISGALKDIAMDLDVPVVVVSQLSRTQGAGGFIPVPKLSKLRGSGAIEQDADTVIFPHRKSRDAEFGDIWLAKQRQGPADRPVAARFIGRLTRWAESPNRGER